jgi:hypothetical protein
VLHDWDEGHAELDDAHRAEIIQWASRSKGCLIEAHSHGSILLPARMSRFDLAQLEEWVPHVRWRLGGRPYAALVTASKDLDGLAWIGTQPEAIAAVHVDGRRVILTSGRTIQDWLKVRAG